MDSKKIYNDLLRVEEVLTQEKGDICLVSLLKPEGEDYWDLFIAASWVKIDFTSYINDAKFVGALLSQYLDRSLANKIATVFLLHTSEIFVTKFLEIIEKNKQPDKLVKFEINGAGVEEAYIFKPYPVEKNASDENITHELLSLLNKIQLHERDNFLNFLNSLEKRKQIDVVKVILDIPSLEQQITEIKQLSNYSDDPSEEIIKTPGNYPYLAVDNTKPKQAA